MAEVDHAPQPYRAAVDTLWWIESRTGRALQDRLDETGTPRGRIATALEYVSGVARYYAETYALAALHEQQGRPDLAALEHARAARYRLIRASAPIGDDAMCDGTPCPCNLGERTYRVRLTAVVYVTIPGPDPLPGDADRIRAAAQVRLLEAHPLRRWTARLVALGWLRRATTSTVHTQVTAIEHEADHARPR